MSLVSFNPSVRVRVRRQNAPADLGPWCVLIYVYGRYIHVARHSRRSTARTHADRVRRSLRGER